MNTSPCQPARKRFNIRSQKPGANWLCDMHSNVYPKKQPWQLVTVKALSRTEVMCQGKPTWNGPRCTARGLDQDRSENHGTQRVYTLDGHRCGYCKEWHIDRWLVQNHEPEGTPRGHKTEKDMWDIRWRAEHPCAAILRWKKRMCLLEITSWD